MVWTITNLRTSVDLSAEASELKLLQRAYAETSRLSCMVSDEAGTLDLLNEDELVLMDGALKAFQGPVRVKKRADRGVSTQRTFTVECQDYTTFLGDDIIPNGTVRSTVESDKARIAWLGATFGTRGLVFSGATIVQLRASMPEQDFSKLTLHQALTLICSITGGSFYVDYDKVLHYHSSEVISAPFGLSDTPNGTTTFGFHGLTLTDDTTAFVNEVLVVGEGVSTTRYLGGSPPAAGTRRAAVLEDSTITTLADAQAAGDAFIAKYGVARQPSELRTYRPGLRAGMTIQITHAGYGLVAATYRISGVEAAPLDRDRIEYVVYIGSSQISLASLMRQADQTTAHLQAAVAAAPDAAIAAVSDLSAGGGNLVPNSSFEDQTSWTPGASWAIGVDPVSPQEPFAGVKVARYTPSGSSAALQTPFLPVARGSVYWASAWIFCRAFTSGRVRMLVEEYNAASALLATTIVGEVAAVSTEWTRYARKFAPAAGVGVTGWQATTTKIRIVFSPNGVNATGTWDVDGVQLERGDLVTAYAAAPYELIEGSVGSTVIADDAVTTAKVIANAIVAGKVAAGAIGVAQLQANSVEADKIDAQAVRADKLLVSYTGSYLTNPSFETNDLTGWASANGNIYTEASTGPLVDGIYWAILNKNGAGDPEISQIVPVRTGEKLTVSLLAGNFVSATGCNIVIGWRNSAGTEFSYSSVALPTAAGTARLSATLGPAPAGAVAARIIILNNNAGTFLGVDDIVVHRGSVEIDASGIVIRDGSLMLINAGGTVVIDGTSNMFKIVASGTLNVVCAANTYNQETTVTLSALGTLSATPAHVSFIGTDTAETSARKLGMHAFGSYQPGFVAGASGGSPTSRMVYTEGTAEMYTALNATPTGTAQIKLFGNNAATSSVTFYGRYHVLKELAV